MEQSPRLSLSYLAPSQAQKHVTVNESFRRLDQLVQMTVKSRTLAAQPGSPSEGDAYLMPASATGADWSGFSEHSIAAYQDDVWVEFAPYAGLRLWDESDGALLVFDGAAWGGPERLGVNASPDAANRFVARTNAVLFDALDAGEDGDGDCQVKINKETVADTGSVLFQTGFSGRAEFGLAGDDKFHIKVSPDNFATSYEAVVIDNSNGNVGVGTSSPDRHLHISDPDEAYIRIESTDTVLSDSETLGGIEFEANDAGGSGVNAYLRVLGDGFSGAGQVRLGAGPPGSAADVLVVRQSGLVGVGEMSPQQELHVAGTIRIDDPYPVLELFDSTAANIQGVNGEIRWADQNDNEAFSLGPASAGTFGIVSKTSDGHIKLQTNGTNTRLDVHEDGSLVAGSPTGGAKGAGTLNAEAVYDDNTLLSCYVFDQAIDGGVDVVKWDNRVPDRSRPDIKRTLEKSRTVQKTIEVEDPKTGQIVRETRDVIEVYTEEEIIEPAQTEMRDHQPLRKFQARIGGAHDPLTLDGYAKHWKEKRHLSSMPNEAKFDPEKGLTTGEWIQRLVETVEIQAVLIEQLNARSKAGARSGGR